MVMRVRFVVFGLPFLARVGCPNFVLSTAAATQQSLTITDLRAPAPLPARVNFTCSSSLSSHSAVKPPRRGNGRHAYTCPLLTFGGETTSKRHEHADGHAYGNSVDAARTRCKLSVEQLSTRARRATAPAFSPRSLCAHSGSQTHNTVCHLTCVWATQYTTAAARERSVLRRTASCRIPPCSG